MTTKTFYHAMEQTACLQDLIGGVPVGTITGLLGPPGAGKSTLGMQALAEIVAQQKGNLLIFDTENKFHVFMHLCEGLSERFGLNLNMVRVKGRIKKGGTAKEPTYAIEWEFEDDVDAKATNVFVVHCPNVTPISIMLGAGFELKTYESGKFKVISLAGAAAGSVDITEAPIAKFLQKYKCVAMLFDSITNPFDIIPAVGENFPARADAEQIVMLQLHSLAAEYDLPILMTVHESKNETSLNKQLKLEGGKSIGYNLAYVLYLMDRNEPGLLPKGAVKPTAGLPRDMRAVFVSRAPSRQPWRNVRYFTITYKGLVDGDGEASNEDADDKET